MEVDFNEDIYQKYLNGNLAHAFLIETNNLELTYQKTLNLCQKLECPQQFKKKCNDCQICNLIAKNNHPNLITISPETDIIKKGQIAELKNQISFKPAYTKHNIYIIKKAETLNTYAANALLQVLEEPQKDIIGFLITTGRAKVLPTILSRCQTYLDLNLPTIDKETSNIRSKAEQFYELIQKQDAYYLLLNKEIALILKGKKQQKIFFNQLLDRFTADLKSQTDSLTLKKMIILSKTIEKLQFNVNIELLLDDLVIKMGDLNA